MTAIELSNLRDKLITNPSLSTKEQEYVFASFQDAILAARQNNN